MTRTEMIQMLLDRVQSQNAALGSGAGTALSGAGTALSDRDRYFLNQNAALGPLAGRITGGVPSEATANAALGSLAGRITGGTALSGAGTALSDSDRELLLRNRIPQSILGKLTGGIITPSFESVVKNTLRNLSDSDREMLLRKKAKQKKRKKQ